MPAEDGVWRDNGGEVPQELSANGLTQDRQSPTLVIIEARELRTKLFAQDAVLFAEVLENPLLLAVKPACQTGEHEELR